MPDRPEPHSSPSAEVTFLGDYGRKLVTNTFFNVIGRLSSFLLTLVLTPFILAHLGVQEFGTWVLFSVFINSFNLLDLGLGFSFIKYVSEYHALGDHDRLNRVIFSGLCFYGVLGVAITAIGLLLESSFLRLFNAVADENVYLFVLLAFTVSNVSGMFLSVIRGVQRMDKSNSLEIKIGLIQAAGTVVALTMGLGMRGLAVNALVTAIIGVILAWWTVRRVVPSAELRLRFDARLLRSMFGYGAKIQVSRLGGLICFHMDKLILSSLFGIAYVSFYEVSSRLASFMRAVPLVMISALIPATSELGARNDRDKILKTYFLAARYVAMVTVALCVFLVIEAGTVIHAWLGPGFEASVPIVQILAIGYAINVMGGAASQTGAGIGRPDFDMKGTILLIVLNPILSVSLARVFGAAGAAAGTSIALSVAAAYLVLLFHREYVQTAVGGAFRDIYLRPAVAGLLAAVAVLGLHAITPAAELFGESRRLAILKLAIDGAVFLPVYLVLLVALRQVTRIDRNNFLGLMSFGFEFLRHPSRERVKIYR